MALFGTWAATLLLVLSCAVLVGRRDSSHGEPRALALDLSSAHSQRAAETRAPSLDADLDAAASAHEASSHLAAFDTSGSHVVLDTTVVQGQLTPEQQAQLDELVAQLEYYQGLKAAAEQSISVCQEELAKAEAALVAAQAMPETTGKELRAKKTAIKKATSKINSMTKAIIAWQTKITEYDSIMADVIDAILAIDPDYFNSDPSQNTEAPGQTTGVTATAVGSNTISVAWPDVDNASAYNIFWSTTPGVTPENGTMISNATSPCSHGGLMANTTYYYIVGAVNDIGMGPPSSQVSAHVPAGGGGSVANLNSKVGLNFVELTYYSPEWVFTDAMRQSMPWIPQQADTSTWDTGYPLHVDSNGWPILGTNPAGHPEAAGTVMYRSLKGHYPAGQYTCLYDGAGTIQFSFDAHTVSSTPGRILVDVTPGDDGIYLKITASNASNPIRNVRMMLPGFENTTETFHPLFIQRIAPFKVLRFMDWQRTNACPNKNWSERNTTLTPSQDDKRGVALEHMIDLCNKTGADAWFCIPHLATDDYITKFATMVRDRLDPDLKVYIEHSNEIWNGMFGGSTGQYQYCIDKGKALNLDPTNQWVAGLRYHSQQSVHIFSIFESVFGGTSRLERVLAAQSANPWAGVQVMDWQNAYQHADALAVAPYFGYLLDDSPNVVNMSTQQILNYLANDIATVQNDFNGENNANTQARGLKLVGYEAGQHLTGVGANLTNGTVTAKFIAANKDPGMYGLYQQSLQNWQDNGGDVNCMFAGWSGYTQWGSWGAMEKMDQDPSPTSSPKYASMVDFIAQQQAAAGGQ